MSPRGVIACTSGTSGFRVRSSKTFRRRPATRACRSRGTRAATNGRPTATNTDETIRPMPDASATRQAPAFGLTAKIFVASVLLVVAVLGITFGVTSVKANHTADASIHRALLATRRAVDDYLAARTRTLGRASTVATDVPQYRQRLLNQRARAEALDQADDVRGLIGAAWVLVTNTDGILIARTDYREQYDRDLSIAPLVANALSGDQTSGAWLDDVQGTMYMAIGTPLRDRPTAAPLGALVATYQIDDSLATAIKQTTNSDVVFFALDTLNKPVVVGSTLA